ncbi:UDP-N-acetylmuramoyl-L-alanyl-D-glutamate--2,6-diaminopimelate ligase [Actinoplanes sp. L3-i22]|uniref:UDP-N-acetylmuramoyl-L-alanyl-D-glutamate--2, 6-diaminopimelate ligase n=1 Tax=Actinoplanes sp. L3-i22 TaxID=2836373 RepID=UPI001C77CBF9|nr:UDP-N-acetylmuramoyl-L-alanyl-D-glutamate--2,6-diaminopimelate ligase [Actinoplanes sp. L3-i22]BCY06620.1 UDP-N-acetylmuramoyl-L-alanyl-D-glutamate--2,6-diaminopimelate ligase [Actinoplanes sp. L3-i22]
MSGIPRPETVAPLPLSQLAQLLEATLHGGDIAVTGVTHSSGAVRPGDLYAALPGANRHGAEFVADAARLGAVAVLTNPDGRDLALAAGLPVLVAEDPRAVLGAAAAAIYGEPSRRLTMIGITGTAGKTSTSYLVEAGLRAAGKVTGLVGTVETRLGDFVVKSVRTTPEAPDLQAILAAGVERGVSAVVMEVSSHALVMGRADGIRFAASGYTNFGQDHLDFHPTSEEYFAAKARLFDGRSAIGVLNYDDPAVMSLSSPETVTYSATGDSAATWWAADVRPSAFGQLFTAHGPGGRTVATGVALPGLHNVANALLALALLAAVGIDPEVAGRGILECRGVPGRLEQVEADSEVLGVVDYAHKPNAIVAALAALRELATARGGQLICVLGAGGDRDRGKRPLMGEAAAHGADLVIITDDNPRTEDPSSVREAVRRGAEEAHTATKVVEVAGRRAAIDEAVRLAAAGDVIAVLGKGNEQGQEVNGQVLPFDDRIELAAALGGRS